MQVIIELDPHQEVPKTLLDKGLDPYAQRGAILRRDGIIETHLFPKIDDEKSILAYPEVRIVGGSWKYKESRAAGKVQVHYRDVQPVLEVRLQFPNDEVPDDALAFLGVLGVKVCLPMHARTVTKNIIISVEYMMAFRILSLILPQLGRNTFWKTFYVEGKYNIVETSSHNSERFFLVFTTQHV